jgi:hypothetical protein
MSSDVPVKPRKLKKTQRFIKLVEGMRKGIPFTIIAKQCDCSEKTIDRDFLEWKDNGGFDKWLLNEFMILHDDEVQKEVGSQAYKVISELLKKRLKEQSEIEVIGIPKFAVEIIDNSKQSDNQVQASPETT